MARKRARRYRISRRKQRGGRAITKKKSKQPDPGPSQCHPSIGKVVPAHGCLPIEVLQEAAKKMKIDPNLDGAALRAALAAQMKHPPGGERSFLEGLTLPAAEKAKLAKKYLRPAYPKEWVSDPDKWLDSNNIKAVMDQYEEARTINGVKEFEFMGPFPIDFAAPDPYHNTPDGSKRCLQTEICELRVQKALENGVKSVGIVYNLDPHYKSGSHWVANYIDIPGNKCYYLDSYGVEPPPQVEKFMKWLTTQDPEMKLEYSKKVLQKSNTECGMFCLYIISRLIEGDGFVEITRRNPADSDMIDYRDWLFST